MKRGWLWVTLLLSLGVNVGILSTIGVARLRTGAGRERIQDGGPPPFARLANHLELEGEQREKFLEIQRSLFHNTGQQRQQLEGLRSDLRREVMRNEPEPARVDRLLDEIGQVNQALDRTMVESLLATRQILTPDQQRRYFRVIERLRESSRHSGPRRGPPGRRPPRDP